MKTMYTTIPNKGGAPPPSQYYSGVTGASNAILDYESKNELSEYLGAHIMTSKGCISNMTILRQWCAGMRRQKRVVEKWRKVSTRTIIPL